MYNIGTYAIWNGTTTTLTAAAKNDCLSFCQSARVRACECIYVCMNIIFRCCAHYFVRSTHTFTTFHTDQTTNVQRKYTLLDWKYQCALIQLHRSDVRLLLYSFSRHSIGLLLLFVIFVIDFVFLLLFFFSSCIYISYDFMVIYLHAHVSVVSVS